jgi:hypothetical protein
LEHQAGSRAFDHLAGAGLVRKWVKNQGRKLMGCESVLHGCLRGSSIMAN